MPMNHMQYNKIDYQITYHETLLVQMFSLSLTFSLCKKNPIFNIKKVITNKKTGYQIFPLLQNLASMFLNDKQTHENNIF